jgi:ribosome-associated protein
MNSRTRALTPFSLSKIIIAAADSKKAWNITRINVKAKTTVADYFVICEGETDRQVRTIADAVIEEAAKWGVKPLRVEGYEEGSWVLIDFDAVVAHIFLPGERSYYNLEELWRTTYKLDNA